jgi:hypothetical protein
MYTAERLRRGNTELIAALMDMVAQFFHEGPDGLFTHRYMSAEEGAIKVLISAGFAIERDGGYELLWDKLEKRRLSGELAINRSLLLAGLPDKCHEIDAAHWDMEASAWV